MSLLHGDCLDLMLTIPDGSVDMVLADLPYETTACKWDCAIPFKPLWEQYRRVTKPNAAIVLTAAMPFTAALVASNYDAFKYTWVWDKAVSTGFLNAKKRPLVRHEDIAVFCFGTTLPYWPQMRTGKDRMKGGRKDKPDQVYGSAPAAAVRSDQYYPTSVLEVSNANRADRYHPTQKPVPLFEYLIRTYTNEGDTVLDNTMGSGTTGVACKNTGRNFIGIEKDAGYFALACERINATGAQATLALAS